MRKVISSGRLASLAVFMLVLLVLYLTRLYRLQVIEGEQAYEASTNSIVSYETVAAARGNILDRYGRLLVSNRNCNNLVIDEDELFIDNDNERINADILELCRLITEHGDGYNDELPISMTAPFEFKESLSDIETELLQAWLAANGLKSDASAVEVMAKMRTRYGIDNNYSAEDMRIIAGVRYSINVRYVINTSDYTFAQDVSIETITALMESNIGGVDVTVSYIREYNTQYAAHILGYTGLMTDADYEKIKELGYSFNASVGKDGRACL
jgi:Cell division protein FtsI/penicillin-binding protein 2